MQKTNTTNLIIFAFKGTHAEKVLAQIPFGVKVLVPSDANQIPHVVHTLLKAQPYYILGLGQYSGKDADLLKIETYCSNKFRNTVRGARYDEIRLDNFLTPGLHSRYAKSMGNSYCNLISYLIMSQIREKNLQTKNSFVHIPRSFDVHLAMNKISRMI